MRALSASTRRGLRDAVAERALDPALVAFVQAVVLQTARPLGIGARRGIVRREAEVINRVIGLLGASVGDEQRVVLAATELASDLPLLSAFFQNLDLLPPSGSATSDAIALLVVMAMSRLEETRSGE